MMYDCAPRGAAGSRAAGRLAVRRGRKRLTVDLHCHVHTPAADEVAAAGGSQADVTARYGDPRIIERQKRLRAELDCKLTWIGQRLADMDRMGIDVQAIPTSPLQYYYALEPGSRGTGVSRLQRCLKACGFNPDRC
jgi:aminocarboxymuconate-semialdehyde decarboxylase